MNFIQSARAITKFIFNRQPEQCKYHIVGSYNLVFPHDHPLDTHQKNYKRYNMALGDIASIIYKKYPNITAIDIGANVGDTAALICTHQIIPVLCVEGDNFFINFLEKNAATMGNHVEIARCFVGNEQIHVDQSKIERKYGTASLVNATMQTTTISLTSLKSLSTILQQHPRFSASKLLKIDTDGYDFSIILNSLTVISDLKPIIFFEYDPSMSKQGEIESLAVIKELMRVGYKKFIVYDNFGNYMLAAHDLDCFIDLNAYLRSNIRFKKIVYYFDVCAFHDEDSDLFEALRTLERSV